VLTVGNCSFKKLVIRVRRRESGYEEENRGNSGKLCQDLRIH
jgi:hypothetical protein